MRGIKCERMACCADVRPSHSRAMAVARCGFDGGIRRGVRVLGLRTGRESRWTTWLFSRCEHCRSAEGSTFANSLSSMLPGTGGWRPRTAIPLNMDFFPEPLLHGRAGLRLGAAQLMALFEQLGLSAPPIHALAILSGRGLWCGRRWTGCGDGQWIRPPPR